MFYPTNRGRFPRLFLPPIILSADGYVRLTQQTLESTSLTHLVSGLADESGEKCLVDGQIACIAGYTEWISNTIPVLSLGWDWRLEVALGVVRNQRIGCPYSNIMLVDHHYHDLGQPQSDKGVTEAVDKWAWQEIVYKYVAARYS